MSANVRGRLRGRHMIEWMMVVFSFAMVTGVAFGSG